MIIETNLDQSELCHIIQQLIDEMQLYELIQWWTCFDYRKLEYFHSNFVKEPEKIYLSLKGKCVIRIIRLQIISRYYMINHDLCLIAFL